MGFNTEIYDPGPQLLRGMDYWDEKKQQQFRNDLAMQQEERAAELHPLTMEQHQLAVDKGKLELEKSKLDLDTNRKTRNNSEDFNSINAYLSAASMIAKDQELDDISRQRKFADLAGSEIGKKTAAAIARSWNLTGHGPDQIEANVSSARFLLNQLDEIQNKLGPQIEHMTQGFANDNGKEILDILPMSQPQRAAHRQLATSGRFAPFNVDDNGNYSLTEQALDQVREGMKDQKKAPSWLHKDEQGYYINAEPANYILARDGKKLKVGLEMAAYRVGEDGDLLTNDQGEMVEKLVPATNERNNDSSGTLSMLTLDEMKQLIKAKMDVLSLGRTLGAFTDITKPENIENVRRITGQALGDKNEETLQLSERSEKARRTIDADIKRSELALNKAANTKTWGEGMPLLNKAIDGLSIPNAQKEVYRSQFQLLQQSGEPISKAQTIILDVLKAERQHQVDLVKLNKSLASQARQSENEQSKARRDIAVRLREAQRGYQNAVKSGDPDTINDAISFIESLNSDAADYGLKPMPVPKRMYSTAEEDALKSQAIKNLDEQRSGIPKFLGIKPNIIAINAEVRRLKQNAKPGEVFNNNTTTTQQTQADMPAAEAHKGRTITDTLTGRRYKSNGSSWIEVQQ